MISIDQAQSLVLQHAGSKPPTSGTVSESVGRILAEDVVSDIDSPPHDKSLVDGYAVIASDLASGMNEFAVLEEVTALRARYQPKATIHDQAVVSEATSTAVRSLFAVVENYPELKTHQNVMALQEEIERLETLIARRRELFNNQVYQYNSTILQLPAVLVRPLFGWQTVDSFSATDEERERPEASVYATK